MRGGTKENWKRKFERKSEREIWKCSNNM